MKNWTGSISVILTVTNENCHEAVRTLSLYCTQDWPNRELIVVNSSRLTLGSGYREIRVSEDTPEIAMHAAAVAVASGEVCLVWKAGQLYPENCLSLIAPHVDPNVLLELTSNGYRIAYAHNRRASIPDLKKTVKVEVTPLSELPKPRSKAPVQEVGNPNRLNIRCPAGIGDMLWILAKLGHLPNAVFWLPEGEQQRSGALCRMAGVNYGYVTDLTTDWVWEQKGDPELPEKGWVTVQANRHLENGQNLRTWYPEQNLNYPALRLSYQPPEKEYVVAFACSGNYMGGQLQPDVWSALLSHVERTIGPVLLVGAGQDVAFSKQVEQLLRPAMTPMYDKPLEEVMSVILSAKAAVGVASGLMIASVAYGVPTMIAYPSHLNKMPGTWEPKGATYRWCFTKDLPFAIRCGELASLLKTVKTKSKFT